MLTIRLLLLIVVSAAMGCRTPAPSVTAAPSSTNWEKEIRAFEQADRTNPPPREAILFVGSSSIRMWKTLAEDFPQHRVINRGFGGSQIIDSVFYADRIVIPYHPRLVVVYAGGNDINAGKTPEQVFEDFQDFAALVWSRLPRTRLAYISIAPNPKRWEQVDKTREVNRRIQEFAQKNRRRLVFIDVSHDMLGPDGKPRPEIFLEDRLHMNASGYAIWKRVVAPYLH